MGAPFDDGDIVATTALSTMRSRRIIAFDCGPRRALGKLSLGRKHRNRPQPDEARPNPLRPAQTNELIKRRSADCRAFFVFESLEMGIRIALPRT